MSQLDPTTRPIASGRLARPTAALAFVGYSAYLTLLFTTLGLLERTGLVIAMAAFSTGVLLVALSAHTRLVAAGRLLEGDAAERSGLPRVSLQVLVVGAVLSAVALLSGQPGDAAPAVATAVTALIAGTARVATSIAAARSAG